MRKILFVSALALTFFAILQSCQKTETSLDQVADPAQLLYDQELQSDIDGFAASHAQELNTTGVQDRVNYTLVLSAIGSWASSADYVRVTYINSSNVVTTVTVSPSSPGMKNFTVKGGTTMDIKHRMTHSSLPDPYFDITSQIKHQTGCTSNLMSYHYQQTVAGTDNVISYICQAKKDDGSCTFSNLTCPCGTDGSICN
ncbi:MAG: hypothetical protein IT269_14880 [Saprospiraceae bacterium]|nr:hypothetical protein [Saprospiraceae bacterium]